MTDRLAAMQNLKRINQFRFLLYLHWLGFIDRPRWIPLKATIAAGVLLPLLLLVR
ncbi:MAG: hypothetical protein ABIJ65_11935 [Chloroflexota bacterium]